VGLAYVLDDYILWGIWLLAIPVGAFAFGHALLQRADAFTAAEKLTKPAWLGITGAGLLVLVVFQGPRSPGALFWLAGLIAVLIYLVDVRPKVTEVQRGPRW
jgi:hypothetical protein